ncbi:MAG TPA: hypothetical protein VHT26_12970 [Trebonia sp.]|nr:hypothetical protein [Trebonia sp.]
MDEVSFGPKREIRLPSRYRRVFAALTAVVAVGAIAAGAALAVTTTGARNATSAPRAASAPAVAPVDRESCPPVHVQRPNLAALPAGMRPGALKVIIDSEFSGQCLVSQ